MRELFEVFEALNRLGAEWKARRLSELYLRDTIECTALIQTDEGVVRGVVRVSRNDVWRVKAEVACYLGGRLKDDGTFKHASHPSRKTVKLFEYTNTVLYKYLRGLFGFGASFRPIGMVPAEHRYLADFAEQLWAEAEAVQKAAEAEKTATAAQKRQNNEVAARRALFG